MSHVATAVRKLFHAQCAYYGKHRFPGSCSSLSALLVSTNFLGDEKHGPLLALTRSVQTMHMVHHGKHKLLGLFSSPRSLSQARRDHPSPPQEFAAKCRLEGGLTRDQPRRVMASAARAPPGGRTRSRRACAAGGRHMLPIAAACKTLNDRRVKPSTIAAACKTLNDRSGV